MIDVLLATLTLLATTGAPTSVTGTGSCPAASEVQARLNELVVADDRPGETYTAEISQGQKAITLFFKDSKGQIIATRDLSNKASCPDRVAAAAVIIATWEVELRGLGNLALSQPAAPAVTLTLDTPEPPAPHWSIGGGIGYAFTSDASAPGLWLQGAHRRDDRRLQWHTGVGVNHAYRLPLGQGEAQWSRLGVYFGPALGTRSQRFPADFALQAGASLLSMRGVGQVKNGKDSAVDPELRISARVGFRKGNTVPWVAALFGAHPLHRTVALEPGNAERTMPVFELALLVGFSFDI